MLAATSAWLAPLRSAYARIEAIKGRSKMGKAELKRAVAQAKG
jgi:hypothetical protein